ncbi:NAD(P)/FAD-dependent oxidoreductase [Sphingobacterium sp. HJSM2_6]|uniref:NAD(P)/FAD-dependent oxidoreductase n=1 Tax=Sphingobacterium sp. HJSM2_6 TaxID=3366264 RepID=UPI003BD4FCC9
MDLKSNEPFWLIKNGLIESYPSLYDEISCDVLVVGSGITGSLAAHQCVEDGYHTVLIDKREVVNGSSSATTSMLQYEVDVPLYELQELIGKEAAIASYHACGESILKLQKICKQIKSQAGFKRKQSLYFASRKSDLAWLSKEYDARKNAGFAVQWIDEETLAKTYHLNYAYGGILSDLGASVDAFNLAHELLFFNVQRGLKVFDKTHLTGVISKKDGEYVSLQTGGKIKAKKIIYCVGFESANMIKEKFVNLLSTYAIVSEINPSMYASYDDLLLWNTSDPYLYMRTTDDGRFLIGGEDEEFHNPVKRDELLAKKGEKLEKSFLKVFQNLEFRTDFTWAGTFGSTKDGLPYIGEHRDFKNSYFVLGFGGNGITFSVTGMDMLSLWLEGKQHELSPYFAFGR